MDVEGVIGAVEGDDAAEMIVRTTFLDGGGKDLGGPTLAFFEIIFLTPEGTARHWLSVIWMGVAGEWGGGKEERLIIGSGSCSCSVLVAATRMAGSSISRVYVYVYGKWK